MYAYQLYNGSAENGNLASPPFSCTASRVISYAVHYNYHPVSFRSRGLLLFYDHSPDVFINFNFSLIFILQSVRIPFFIRGVFSYLFRDIGLCTTQWFIFFTSLITYLCAQSLPLPVNVISDIDISIYKKLVLCTQRKLTEYKSEFPLGSVSLQTR